MDQRLTSVLGFSTAITANSGQSNEPLPKRDPQDFKWLQQALEATRPKDEATQMKELLAVAIGQEKEEDRLMALEDFQLLIEHPYNAGNIQKMNMWEPLINLLQDPSDAIQRTTLSIFGSAIQNDENTRGDFDKYDLLPRILEYLRPKAAGTSAKAKGQAISCLTQALKHNRAGVQKLEALDLWKILSIAFEDSELKVKRSIAWLFYVLLLGDGFTEITHRTTTDLARSGMVSGGSLPIILGELKRPDADPGFKEEAAAALLSYLRAGGEVTKGDLEPLGGSITSYGEHKDWHATREEWDRLLQRCSR